MKIDFTNFEGLSELINILEACKSAGFELNSSTFLQPILETMIDLSLKISTLDDECNIRFHEPANKELVFLDNDKADCLGNSAQKQIPVEHKIFDEGNKIVKVKFESIDSIPTETISSFFGDLAEFLSRLKYGHLNKSFMDLLLKMIQFGPEPDTAHRSFRTTDEVKISLRQKSELADLRAQVSRLQNENRMLKERMKMIFRIIKLDMKSRDSLKSFRIGD